MTNAERVAKCPAWQLWIGGTVLALVACGGGGSGGDDGRATPIPAPNVVLAPDAGVFLPTTMPFKHFRGIDARVPSALRAEGYANVENWTGTGSARSVNASAPLNQRANGELGTIVNYTIAADGVHDLSGGFLVDDALVLRSPVLAGDRYTVVDRAVSVPDVDGDGRVEQVQIKVDIEVVGAESVTVPAGTFRDAVKVVTTAGLRITASRTATQASVTLVSTDWYMAQLGRVKTVFVDGSTPAGMRGNMVTEELVGYRDATRRFGALASRPLFDAPLRSKSPPAVVVSGGLALVVAATGDVIGSQTIHQSGAVKATLVGADGIPGSTLTLIDSVQHGGFTPAVVDDARGDFVVAVGDGLGLRAQRVAANGVLRDGRTGITVYTASGFVLTPALSRIGNRLLAAWAERSSEAGAQVIRTLLIDATSLQPLSSPTTIRSPTGYAGFPRLATDGQGWLLVFSAWQDSGNHAEARAYPATLHAMRLSEAGVPLDATSRALSHTGTAHSVADVLFDGTDYVVTWADNRNHLAAAAGVGSLSPVDAWTGTFVQDIFASRLVPATGLAAAGTPATGFAITQLTARRDSPRLAMVGTRLFEVHSVFGTSASDGLYYRWLESPLVGAAADVADNRDAIVSVETFGVRDGPYGQSVVASHGGGALVAFHGGLGANGYAESRIALILPPVP